MHPVSRSSVNRLFALGLVAAIIGLTSRPAYADCVNPPGPEGRLIYNSSVKVAQVCDGTNWIALGGSSGGGGSVTVPGNDTEVIFNDGGVLGANAGFVFDKTTANLGLGVATPTQKLDIAGTATAQGILLKPIAGDPPAPGGAPNLGDLADVDTTDQADGRILTYNSTTSQWEAATIGGGTLAGGSAGYLGVWSSATALGTSSTSAGQQFFWDATNHRLGIGTNSPTAKLDVVGDTFTTGTYAQNAYFSGGWKYRAAGAASAFFRPNHLWSGGVFGLAYAPAGSADAALTWGPGVTIDSDNGNVGIGTTTPIYPLHVSSTAGLGAEAVFYNPSLANASVSSIRIGKADAINQSVVFEFKQDSTASVSSLHTFGDSFGNALTIKKGGNIGIGTSNPNYKLDIANGWLNVANGIITRGGTGYGGNDLGLYSGQSGIWMRFVTNNGAFAWSSDNTAASTIMQISQSGTLACVSGCPNGISDKRMKKDVRAISDADGLDAILKLKPVSFHWKDAAMEKKLQYGFIAQDVLAVFPNLVSDWGSTKITLEDGTKQELADTQKLNSGGLIGPLVKAVQELKAENDNLRAEYIAQIDELRAEIRALQAARR